MEKRPLLGRVLSYDAARALQELDRELAAGNLEQIAALCGSTQSKVREVLAQRGEALWSLQLAGVKPEHAGRLYGGLIGHVPPPDDGAWFLRQFGSALEGKPNELTFQAGKLQGHLSPHANSAIAAGVLARFEPGKRLAWPHISTLGHAADNGWQPEPDQLEVLRLRLEQNLGTDPLVSARRPEIQVETVLLMDVLAKLPESASWSLHGRPMARELFERLLASPEARLYDLPNLPGKALPSDADAFGRIIARDQRLMNELLEELATGSSPRSDALYLFLAGHGSPLQLATRCRAPEGEAFERVRLHVVDKAAPELKRELPGMEPARGLEAVRACRSLWEGLDESLFVRGLERLQIPEAVGRLALESDFLLAAIAARSAPELEKELLGRIRGLDFPEDSAEATALARLRAKLFTHELRETPPDRKSLLAFYASQEEPSPSQRSEWVKAWGDLDGPESGVLGRLKIDPATARALLERDRLDSDLVDLGRALAGFVQPEQVRSLLHSSELTVLNRFLDSGCSREDSLAALEAYRAYRENGLDEERAFMQAAGRLLGAPGSAAPGGGLSVNSGGLVVGGTFLRKRS